PAFLGFRDPARAQLRLILRRWALPLRRIADAPYMQRHQHADVCAAVNRTVYGRPDAARACAVPLMPPRSGKTPLGRPSPYKRDRDAAARRRMSRPRATGFA